jgi:alcohol-forming fatty acyl-CoA reductase
MILDENVRVDLIPVDVVINLMVAVAWKTGSSKNYNISVYNCCSGQQKPITWGAFVDLCLKNMRENPIGELLRMHGSTMIKYQLIGLVR